MPDRKLNWVMFLLAHLAGSLLAMQEVIVGGAVTAATAAAVLNGFNKVGLAGRLVWFRGGKPC